MYSVELYAKVRRAVMVDQCSEREAARLFGIHRKTVKKIGQYAVPPGYQRKNEPISPKLSPFKGIIDAILEADKQVHVKQRHTALRILESCTPKNRCSATKPSSPKCTTASNTLPGFPTCCPSFQWWAKSKTACSAWATTV